MNFTVAVSEVALGSRKRVCTVRGNGWVHMISKESTHSLPRTVLTDPRNRARFGHSNCEIALAPARFRPAKDDESPQALALNRRKFSDSRNGTSQHFFAYSLTTTAPGRL